MLVTKYNFLGGNALEVSVRQFETKPCVVVLLAAREGESAEVAIVDWRPATVEEATRLLDRQSLSSDPVKVWPLLQSKVAAPGKAAFVYDTSISSPACAVYIADPDSEEQSDAGWILTVGSTDGWNYRACDGSPQWRQVKNVVLALTNERNRLVASNPCEREVMVLGLTLMRKTRSWFVSSRCPPETIT